MFFLSNCSLEMIKDSKEREQKSAQDHVDWTQEELEKYWGHPLATTMHDDGSKTCVYEFKEIDLSNSHLVNEGAFKFADYATLGLSEIYWTPMVLIAKINEENKAPMIRAWVTYDATNKVKFEKRQRVE